MSQVTEYSELFKRNKMFVAFVVYFIVLSFISAFFLSTQLGGKKIGPAAKQSVIAAYNLAKFGTISEALAPPPRSDLAPRGVGGYFLWRYHGLCPWGSILCPTRPP